MWIGSAADIHEQRRLVAELLSTNERIADQQLEGPRRSHDKLFEQLPALIAVLRRRYHRYAFVNPAARKYWQTAHSMVVQ